MVVVKTAPVGQLPVLVEDEELRGGLGAVGVRHFLGLVPQVREGVVLVLRPSLHVLEAILRVLGGVVGVDAHQLDTLGRVVILNVDVATLVRHDVGAMDAEERHAQDLLLREILKPVNLPVHPGQLEVRSRVADLESDVLHHVSPPF